MEPGKYDNGVEVTGPISLQLHCGTKKISPFAQTVLLIGSTGTGKSNFIECLSGGSISGIARDQLDGFTQEVTAYKLVNFVKFLSAGVYIIDAPGFADSRISELRIVELIRKWLERTIAPWGLGFITHILYFDRITDTRVPGSQKKLMSLFHLLIGNPRKAKAVTIVTTMWDALWTESQRERAEQRFHQLRNEHWKELIDHGAEIVRFHNTQTSAAEVVRDSLRRSSLLDYSGFDTSTSIRRTAFLPLACETLLGRVEGLQQRLKTIQDDLQDETILSNQEIVDVLAKEKEETETTLHTFEAELQTLRPPEDRVKNTFIRTKSLFKKLWHTKGSS